MKLAGTLVLFAVAAATPAALAQRWEIGGGAGGGFYTSQDVTLGSSGSAAANLQTNLAGSAWLGNNGFGRWGGELRYDYQLGDFALKSGGTAATFGAHTQQFHYDLLWYTNHAGSTVRPFVSAGAGIKLYQGTGTEVVYQPLEQYALLTKAQDLTPLVSIGAGMKFQLGAHVQLKLEVHDYTTPFPKKVITPNVGAKAGGWLHDFVPMAGISYTTGFSER